jgi:hypothetical protein
MALTLTTNKHGSTWMSECPSLWVIRDMLSVTGTKFGCGTGYFLHHYEAASGTQRSPRSKRLRRSHDPPSWRPKFQGVEDGIGMPAQPYSAIGRTDVRARVLLVAYRFVSTSKSEQIS